MCTKIVKFTFKCVTVVSQLDTLFNIGETQSNIRAVVKHSKVCYLKREDTEDYLSQ